MHLLAATDFIDLIPSFKSGAFKLHDILVPVCVAAGFVGFVMWLARAAWEDNLRPILDVMIRVVVVAALTAGITTVGDGIQGAVEDVNNQVGFNSGNVSADYNQAIATKFASQSTNGGLIGFLFHGGEQIGASIIGAVVWLLSIIASFLMWLTRGVQQMLYFAEIALSPIFLGCFLIPALVSVATRFLTSLVAICLWPLGFTICDLVTKALLDLAINTTGNTGLEVSNATLTGMVWWVCLAVWVILSSLTAPILISKAVVSGSSGFQQMFGHAGGASTSGARMVASIGGGAATGAAGATGTAAATNSVSQPTKQFAKRP
jgi:hypothetical protein